MPSKHGEKTAVTMLDVRKVYAYYGRFQAIRDLSIQVNGGEIVALIGSNGAGKSTVLRSTSGMLSSWTGEMSFCGQSLKGLPPEKIVRLGVSHVPERRGLFGPMSVNDNLLLGAYSRSNSNRKKELQGDLQRTFELFPILKERVNQLAETLSGGEQQMLALARGLMSKPSLLLLDEPSLGLAPLIIKLIMEVISELRDSGTTILLVEQNVRAALKIADRGYVLERGEISLEGGSREIMEDEKVRSAYLGG